jgi:hypothetical protein
MQHDPRVVVTGTALVVFYRAAVKLAGLGRAAQLATVIGGPERHPATVTDPTRVSRTVNAVANHLPIKAKCLPRSLTTWTMLRRRGVAATVRLGVRVDRVADAHAWIEIDGQPLNEFIDDDVMADFDLTAHLPAVLVGPAA